MLPSPSAIAFVIVLLSVSACGSSSSPTAPTPSSGQVAGTWNGVLTRQGGSQTLRLELAEQTFGAGAIVTGRYTATDAGGTATGTVGGVAINGDVSLTLTPSAPPACPGGGPTIVPPGDVLMTLTLTGQQLAGRAVVVQCAGEVVGTATLTK